MSQQIAQTTLDIAGEAAKQGLQGAANYGQSDAGFGVWLGNILTAIMMLGAVACLLFMILGAIEWISSGGDSGKVEKARSRIMNSVIGLIILAAILAVFNLVASFLGITSLKFI